MASAVATAQPAFVKGAQFAPTAKNVALAKHSGILPMLHFGKRNAQGKQLGPLRMKAANSSETTPKAQFITEQPQGTLHNNFYRSGESFAVMMGDIAQLPFDGVCGSVVVADDNKTVYFQNPIGAYYSTSWIVGQRTEGDTIEVKLPQQFVHEVYEDGNQDGYLYKLKPIKVSEDGYSYTTFVPDDDQTVKYVWRNDSLYLVNTVADSKLLGMCNANGEWYGFGDYVSLYEVFNQQATAPKDASKAQNMALTFSESGQPYGRIKKVVKEGNDFFIAGLDENMPNAWVKGTLADNKVTFSGHQYMGIDPQTLCYTFFEPIAHKQEWFDYGDGEGDYYDNPVMLDKIEFSYDPATETLQSDSTFYVNQGYKRLNQMYTYDAPTFTPWTEKATTPMPADKELIYYTPYNEEEGCGYYSFAPSEFDAEGYLLDTKQLYYTIYLDDEPMTFDPEDYPSLAQPTTEMPYQYSDLVDIVYYAGMFNIKTYITGFDRIGVQLIYKGGGEVRKSSIVYVNANSDEDPDGINEIGANGSKVVGTSYTDLSGRSVSRPTQGVYIQTTRMANGTLRSTKRIFK